MSVASAKPLPQKHDYRPLSASKVLRSWFADLRWDPGSGFPLFARLFGCRTLRRSRDREVLYLLAALQRCHQPPGPESAASPRLSRIFWVPIFGRHGPPVPTTPCWPSPTGSAAVPVEL